MVARTCNFRSPEAEAEGVCHEFEASLNYTVRSCIEINRIEYRKQEMNYDHEHHLRRMRPRETSMFDSVHIRF